MFGAAAPAPSAARRQGVLAGQAIGRGDGHRARAVRPRVARRAVRARRVAPQAAPRRVAVAGGGGLGEALVAAVGGSVLMATMALLTCEAMAAVVAPTW